MKTAFKEWASVCRALLAGRQVIILRKGGIAEESGAFKPEYERFLLFPTRFHQSADQLSPEGRVFLEPARFDQPDEGNVIIRGTAHVTQVHRVTNREAILALNDQHIWSNDVVEERFNRWESNLVYALTLRVFALPEPVTLPVVDAYGGCKSWIELERDIPDALATPVLDDDEFETRLRAISERLTQD